MAHSSLPDSLPVITLSGCNLFPHGMLPLYIFEPRYREMVAFALRHDRLIGVSTRLPDAADDDDDAVFPYSTAGLVRACVRGEDGTSNLILQGVQRVRFGEWIQKNPFRIVRIEPIPSRNPNPQRAESLGRELVQTVVRIGDGNADFVAQLRGLPSAEVLADVLAYHVVSDPCTRQPLLEMENVCDRLEFLRQHLASV